MMALFLLGIASRFCGGLEDGSEGWLGTFCMACPLLSILLLGVVAGFIFSAEEVVYSALR
ncbi:putative membrane protein [Candidatus Ichthyocystis hellenicum]|uniref:Putative membrane protein n=2 Tax=Burkholderiales genera incertae sedis TaxID=224471 RepID=A0A0S4M2I8_9BURK|nr:putative membrane protein [Candidatus Ichthyocystis hellenicum]